MLQPSTAPVRLPGLYARVQKVIPAFEWPAYVDDIEAILALKRARHAVILAHNYQAPQIFHCIADVVGDSLTLARKAVDVDADTIVFAGVKFMAETAKLLNPGKTVLLPDLDAGCSLADSVTPEDVRLLRANYPGVPIVAYVNTSAAVKAEVDVCCTSSNARRVVESFGVDTVIMIPDEYLAKNVAAQTKVRIIGWKGHCIVHERFSAAEVQDLRRAHPGIVVLAHPECPPEVVQAADFSGSTKAMSDYIVQKRPKTAVLLTECSMSDNVAASCPEVELIRPCNLCPFMKKITLGNIRACLERNAPVIDVDPAIAAPARRAVERMLAL